MIFDYPPFDYAKKMAVVGCHIVCEGRILLLLRHFTKSQGGMWGVPAGKIEEGETAVDAVCREVQEETSIALSADNVRFFRTVFVRHEGHDFDYHMFAVMLSSLPSVRLSAEEHTDYIWASLDETLEMPLIHDEAACLRLMYPDASRRQQAR